MLYFQYPKVNYDVKRFFHAASYEGGVLLRTTSILGENISETITDMPMCEIYVKEDKSLDVKRTEFNMAAYGAGQFGDA